MDSAYSRVTAGPPSVSDEWVSGFLETHYGLAAAEVLPLPGESERNFRVRCTTGEQVVVRLSWSSEQERATQQSAILAALTRHHPDVAVARPVPTLQGDLGLACDIDDAPCYARVIDWLDGEPLSSVEWRSNELLRDLGEQAGLLAVALAEAGRRAPEPEPHYWDLRRAAAILDDAVHREGGSADGRLYARALRRTESALDALPSLPQALVHHDLHVNNLLVRTEQHRTRVSGIIDLGDAIVTARVCDLAILLASLCRASPDPIHESAAVIATYCKHVPLNEDEVDLLLPLMIARTATVAATGSRLAAEAAHGDPRHRSPLLLASLTQLMSARGEFVREVFRAAAGLPLTSASKRALDWLGEHSPEPMLQHTAVVDGSSASRVFDDVNAGDLAGIRSALQQAIEAIAPAIAVGRHGEPRLLESRARGTGAAEQPTRAYGVRVHAAPGTTLSAPYPGVIEAIGSEVVALRHEPEPGVRFWTVVTGATLTDTVARIGTRSDDQVDVGQPWATTIGEGPATVALALHHPSGDLPPRFVRASELPLWERISPDPSALLGIERWVGRRARIIDSRAAHLPRTHPTYFEQPIDMVRAHECTFIDEEGNRYLDALNNVTLVGHCHPRLTDAARRQLGRLNTNSRFVYDALTDYIERLTATLPEHLQVAYMLNSGSEANDLALTMARHVTGRDDIVVIADAYHGYTRTVADVSPARYKHYGKPEHTHEVPAPDRYRGEFRYGDAEAGVKYARQVIETFDRLIAEGRPPAAFIYEPLLAGGGQVVLPPGYLATIQRAADERGILTIADEVQVGFGRLGEAFWGFQTQGPEVTPDFVTMGKAMGNGFPVAAMVTTRGHSERFDERGRFFATYGGNPASCAVALEMLKIVEDEQLQQNALVVGEYFREQLRELAKRHELIGDVRGQGFYSGIEFVLDRDALTPASEETLKICDRLKDEGVLVYPTGAWWNILKLKPPLTFSRDDVDRFCRTLDLVLRRGW